MTQQKQQKNGDWMWTVAPHGKTVTAYERADRAREVWVRYQDRAGKRHRQSLGVSVRTPKRPDTVNAALRAKAEAKLLKLYDEEIAAKMGIGVMVRAEVVADPPKRPGTLPTVDWGMAHAFSDDGMFAQKNDTYKDCARFRKSIDEFFSGKLFSAVSEKDMRAFSAYLAKKSLDGRGYRSAERTIAFFYQVARWLTREHMEMKDAPRVNDRWKVGLEAAWKANGKSIPVVVDARHTTDEVTWLWEVLYRPEVDPRIRVLVAVFSQLRLGQCARLMRDDLTLLDQPGSEALWQLRIPGEGKKKAGPMVLGHWERNFLHFAMATGYLRELETAYAAGLLQNYPIFPQGRLTKGVIPYEAGRVYKMVNERTVLTWFRQLENVAEEAAKFDRLPGYKSDLVAPKIYDAEERKRKHRRGFYGLRRFWADIAPRTAERLGYTDLRVLDSITGHKVVTMRTRYQKKVDWELLSRAALVRDKMKIEIEMLTPRDSGDRVYHEVYLQDAERDVDES